MLRIVQIMLGTSGTSLGQDSEPVLDSDSWAAQYRARSAENARRWVWAAVAAGVVLVITVGGVAFVNLLGGGGAQPEDVLPANAVAFAKLDLDPSAGQKLAAYRLSSRFPAVRSRVTSEGTSVKESTFGLLFTGDTGMGLDYQKDVAPWLGDRVGIGVFPDLDADRKPEVGLAIAVTDQDAAKVALDKAVANAAGHANAKGHVSAKIGYAFADDFVIVSDTTAHAAALVRAGKATPLAGSTYAEDVTKLGADQIGVAWVDVAATYKAFPKDLAAKGLTTALTKAGGSRTSGRVVTGLHADPSFVELVSIGIDVKGADALVGSVGGGEAAMIASFPSEVSAALTVNGLGRSLGELYASLTAKGDPMGIRPMLSGLGIRSAKDVETLLGAETGLMMGGKGASPQYVLRTRGGNPDAALNIARRVLAGAPEEGLAVRKVSAPPGVVIGLRPAGSGPDLTAAVVGRSGSRLGDTEVFQQVVPQDEKADLVAYADLGKVLPLLAKNAKPGMDLAWLKPLKALGLTATRGTEPAVRLRLSFR